ncbi:MAG: alpha/beta hydrolase [Pseudomonadota bacterium]
MAYIDRDGVNIYYEVHGEGTPILLSHGYSSTAQMWEPQLEALGKTHQLIAWDMRGHGQSDSPEDQSLYSEAATVEDMASILDALEIEKAIIGGLSLGGYMSLAFNLKYPERVQALLLFDTGPGYKKDEAREGWNKQAERNAQKFEEKGLGALIRSSEVLKSTHRSAEGLARAARGMLAQQDDRIIQSLTGINVPTLIVLGENDKPYINATEYMTLKIPGAQKAIITDAGHASNIDQPEDFNRAVISFLEAI